MDEIFHELIIGLNHEQWDLRYWGLIINNMNSPNTWVCLKT